MKKKLVIAFSIYIGTPLIFLGIVFLISRYSVTIDSSDVWVGYLGGLIAYIGTGALGLLAFWQNEKAQKINDKLLQLDLKSKKGLFLPQHLNSKNQVMSYTLSRSLSLFNKGDDFVTIKKIDMFLNGKFKYSDDCKLFCNFGDMEFNQIDLDLQLTEEELQLDKIEIKFELYLKNSKDYQYKQNLYFTFKKQFKDTYQIDIFNLSIDESIGEKSK